MSSTRKESLILSAFSRAVRENVGFKVPQREINDDHFLAIFKQIVRVLPPPVLNSKRCPVPYGKEQMARDGE